MIKVPQCTSKFAPKGKAEPPKWPPASKPQKQGSPWMRKPSANARVEQEGGPYEGASQPARQERALTIRTPTAPPMMRGVTFSPGSTGASMCHGITPLATSPEERRNVLQFAGGPRPAPAVDCSHSDPNIQAAREYYPRISSKAMTLTPRLTGCANSTTSSWVPYPIFMMTRRIGVNFLCARLAS